MNTLQPGIHYGIPASVYHADPAPKPSLSSSLARTILDQSVAHAAIEHPRINKTAERTPTKEMRLGSTVHAIQSGDDSEIVIGAYENFKKKEAQEWRDSVLASGRIPMLTHEMENVKPIANALIAKVGKGISNDPFGPIGKSEVTGIWEEDGVFCRVRFDRLVIDPTGYVDIWDWKTTTDVSDDSLVRKLEEGLYIQGAFYKRGAAKLFPEYRGRISYNFGFVETSPPFSVRRVPLSESWSTLGEQQCSRAIDLWRNAQSANNWIDPLDGETRHLSPRDFFMRNITEKML